MYYLIAHKVRGERGIDIAVKMPMADGDWWIIPTSGHRAYPYWTHQLSDLFAYENIGEPPIDLRDHYTISAPPPQAAKRQRPSFDEPKPEDL